VSYASLTASRLLALDSANVVETTDILSWITGTTNQITVTDDGDGTVTLSIPSGAVLTLANTGLHILDTDSSHDLIIKPGSDLTADKTLTITTGDSDRTITLSGNPTLADWFNQAVKTTSSPTFNVATTLACIHRQTIPSGTTITIPDDYEFIVGNGYNIEGVLDIQGSGALLVI